MTIDIITKAGIQVGVSLSPQELAGNAVLLDFLRQLLGMQAQDVQQTKLSPKKEPRKKKGRPPVIDYGKIGALWEAGWSAEKIADDINCDTEIVIEYLERENLI